MLKLKKWYLSFLENTARNFPEKVLYGFFYSLSLVYGLIVELKNFLYQKRILPSYRSTSKVISLGNISWSGSGKTSLSLWLYEKLSSNFKAAILRRGYGEDEGKLLKEKTQNVFSSPDRKKLAKTLQSQFDLFILDDGFQHRRLRRDLDIVVMGAREFRGKHGLIPAYIFREPLRSLKRADIVVVNYAGELDNPSLVRKRILWVKPELKIHFSRYKFKRFKDLSGKEFKPEDLRQKPLAAFCAIGYPQGFFNMLTEVNLNLKEKIIYPDHHELSAKEFQTIQNRLLRSNIKDLIISSKDRYHLPFNKCRLNVLIMEVDLEIENESLFLQDVTRCIT
jgi:tetraacyldisaccharide 4'-kinase